jgi:hypothetical protein
MFYRIFLLTFLGLKLSCESQKKQPPYASNPIARVHNEYLYKQDVENLLPANTTPQDSVDLIERYIQNWLAKHLLANKAQRYEHNQATDVEQKVAEFRAALIAHNYIQKLVNERLNKEITEEELQRYYEANQEDFKLNHNIVRGKFVVIPKNSPNSHNLKKLIISKEEADEIELQNYCSQYAKDYSLDEKIWLKWDDIITKTPFRKVPDKTRFLKRTSFTEVQDQRYRYYLKIEAYKTINDIAPIELVRDQLRDVIFYKRKIELAKQIKQDILEEAKANNDYTIYEYKN